MLWKICMDASVCLATADSKGEMKMEKSSAHPWCSTEDDSVWSMKAFDSDLQYVVQVSTILSRKQKNLTWVITTVCKKHYYIYMKV